MHFQYEPISDEYLFQDFLKDLFNAIYNTKSFEVYRSKGYAQFGVDVYSPELKLAIQAKKKSILKNEPELIQELKNDLLTSIEDLKKFPHPVEQFYLATTTKKYAAIQDEAIKHSTNTLGVQFWSWEELQKHIHLDIDVRNTYFPHLKTDSLPKELSLTSHLDLNTICGRQPDSEAIRALFATQKIIAVNGIGGAGKSTFAKSFYQSSIDSYIHLLWLDYSTSFKNSIVYNKSLIQNLKINITDADPPELIYQSILVRICALKGKLLVVIDNLSNEDSISVEQEISKLLSHPQINILITSKEVFTQIHAYELSSLPISDAKKLFFQHCPKKVDITHLDDLLKLMDCNPLLTELVAKTIYTGMDVAIPDIIRHFSQSNLDVEQLGFKIDQNTASGKLSAKLYRHVQTIVNPDQFTGDAETYLILTMSLLPATGILVNDLFDFFLYRQNNKSVIIDAITNLHKRGLISRNGNELKMHQIVQDTIRIQYPTFAVYLMVLNSLIHSLDKANISYSANGYKLCQIAESFVAKLKGPKADSIRQPLLMIKNNLYIMYRYLGEMTKAKVFALDIIENLPYAQAFPLRDNIFLATLHHNIATYFMDENDPVQAEIYLEKAVEINGNVFNLNLIQSYNGLFIIYQKQQNLPKAFESATKALEMLQQNTNEDNDHIFATVLCNVAMANLAYNQLDKAASFVTLAIKMHRESKNPRKNDSALAMYYHNAAHIFSLLKNHEVAIQFALNAIEYRGKLNLERDYVLLSHYEEAADVYERAGKPDNANKLREITAIARSSFDDENNLNQAVVVV